MMMMKAAILLVMFACLLVDADNYDYCMDECPLNAPVIERTRMWRKYFQTRRRSQEPVSRCTPSFGSVMYQNVNAPEFNFTWSIDAGSDLLRTTKEFLIKDDWGIFEIKTPKLNPNVHNKFTGSTVNGVVSGFEWRVEVYAVAGDGAVTTICKERMVYPECCDFDYTRKLDLCSVAIKFCDSPYSPYY